MTDATESAGQERTGGPCKARPEDLVERAKEHYLEASDAVCHYNSLIPKALDTWLEVQRERDSAPDKEQTMGGEERDRLDDIESVLHDHSVDTSISGLIDELEARADHRLTTASSDAMIRTDEVADLLRRRLREGEEEPHDR